MVLLDADLGLANADVLCNIDLPYNLSHVIARKKELAEVLVRAPGGFRLIGGASGLARMADLSDSDRQRLVDALAELEQQADVIIIDTGAGISPNVLSFTRAASSPQPGKDSRWPDLNRSKATTKRPGRERPPSENNFSCHGPSINTGQSPLLRVR